jgi:hypothetical protein
MGDLLYTGVDGSWDIYAPAFSTSLYLISPTSGQLVRVEPSQWQRADFSRKAADAAVRAFLND